MSNLQAKSTTFVFITLGICGTKHIVTCNLSMGSIRELKHEMD